MSVSTSLVAEIAGRCESTGLNEQAGVLLHRDKLRERPSCMPVSAQSAQLSLEYLADLQARLEAHRLTQSHQILHPCNHI